MSGRSAARGSEAARSIRLALRTSSIVAVSSAKPSRCALCCRGRHPLMFSPIAAATVAIPPTTPHHLDLCRRSWPLSPTAPRGARPDGWRGWVPLKHLGQGEEGKGLLLCASPKRHLVQVSLCQ